MQRPTIHTGEGYYRGFFGTVALKMSHAADAATGASSTGVTQFWSNNDNHFIIARLLREPRVRLRGERVRMPSKNFLATHHTNSTLIDRSSFCTWCTGRIATRA